MNSDVSKSHETRPDVSLELKNPMPCRKEEEIDMDFYENLLSLAQPLEDSFFGQDSDSDVADHEKIAQEAQELNQSRDASISPREVTPTPGEEGLEEDTERQPTNNQAQGNAKQKDDQGPFTDWQNLYINSEA